MAQKLVNLTNSSISTIWELRSTENLATTISTGIPGAGTAGSGKGAPGRGVKVGDTVRILVVDDVDSLAPTISAAGWAYVTALSSSTGAGTIVLDDDVDTT